MTETETEQGGTTHQPLPDQEPQPPEVPIPDHPDQAPDDDDTVTTDDNDDAS